MRTRSRTRLVTAAGAALLALGLLAGCASSSGTSGFSAPEQAGDSAAQEVAPDSVAANDPAVGDRALVTTGYMGISTPDVAAVTEQVEGIVEGHDGRIDARSESTGEAAQTRLTVRVPADDYDALLEELRGVGTVEFVETNVVDVTMQTVDLEARIASLEASVASLRAMLAQATSVSDMLEVETTLSDREAELQSLRAQQAALADQVAMSTLDITISNDELANPTPDDEGGFLNGLQAGWNALIAFFNGLLTLLGFILPGLILLLVLGALVFFVIRAIVRARDGRRAAPAGPAAAMAGPAQPAANAPAASEAQASPPATAGAGPYAPAPDRRNATSSAQQRGVQQGRPQPTGTGDEDARGRGGQDGTGGDRPADPGHA